jgi:CcmD family protein
VSGLGYLALGFAAVWLLVGGYLAWLGRQQMLLGRRMEELEGRAPEAGEQTRE